MNDSEAIPQGMMLLPERPLYYEVHVTLVVSHDDQLFAAANSMCSARGFWLSTVDDEETSRKVVIATRREEDFGTARHKMFELEQLLKSVRVYCSRLKIEAAVFDHKQ